MKKIATVLSFSLLAACGTEVGNGRQPTYNPGAKADSTTDTSGETESSNNPSPSNVSELESPVAHILVGCASPLAEITASSFTDSTGKYPMTVTMPSAGNISVLVATQQYLLQPNTSMSQPYAIKSDTFTVGQNTCVSTNSVTNGSTTTRTTLYSDGYKTIWTLNVSGEIQTIEVIGSSSISVGKWTVAP